MNLDHDRSLCHHYLYGQVCTRGCWDEPRCITDEPLEGWPLMRRMETFLWAFEPEKADPELIQDNMDFKRNALEVLEQRAPIFIERMRRLLV